ncbi:MAG: HAD-IA family hydrolase [Nitrospiraceae bacterium]
MQHRLRTTYDEFEAIWNAGFRENLPVTGMVLQLCETTGVYGVSNTNPLHFEHLSPHYPIIAALHGRVLSYKVGHRKPSPQIYEAALEVVEVCPEQALYVDDDQEFVEAAELLGMRAIRYRSPPELAAMLGL